MADKPTWKGVERMASPGALRGWRCRLGWWAWLLMAATAIFSAALTLLLAEAVLERLVARSGIWGVGPFFIAVAVMIAGVFALLRSGFGRGALLGSWFRIPPTWVSAALAVLVFWAWLWLIGPAPPLHVHFAFAAGFQRVCAVFTHGWVWLWGAVISCGIASGLWQALLPRLLACCGSRLRTADWLGRELTPLPVDDTSLRADAMLRGERETREATPALVGAADGARSATGEATPSGATAPSDPGGQRGDTPRAVGDGATPPASSVSGAEIDRWLEGNDEPVQPGERDFFAFEPPPRRVLASLRPTHQDGSARTLALIGQRGGGKSSLLRLAEGLPEAKGEVELRFVYLSLWEYETAQAAVRAAIECAVRLVRDRIDTFPFSGAAGAFARAMVGDGRYRWLTEALGLGLRTSNEQLFSALSAILLFNNLRVIICIEDDDRLEDAAQKNQFVSLVTGSLDFIRRFPAFGYVICITSGDWGALQQRALGKVEPPEKQRERLAEIEPLVKQTWGHSAAGVTDRPKNAEGAAGDAGARGESQSQVPGNAGPPEERGAPAAGPQGAENAMKRHIHRDIEVQRRAAAMVAREQLAGFDTARLCREELVIPPLAAEQWKPLLDRVRGRMFQWTGDDPEKDCFGLTAHVADTQGKGGQTCAGGRENAGAPRANGRQLIWEKFAGKLASDPFTLDRPMPEYGLANAEESGFSFTPRSLRRGLGDAWRKWLAMQAAPDKYIRIIDPDSVLVACLVRACRPDVWNILIRHHWLLLGGPSPDTDYLVQRALGRRYAGIGRMVEASRFDKDQPGYGQAWPHLGLSQEIINVMRKTCNVLDLSAASVNQPQVQSQPTEGAEGTVPTNQFPTVEIVRPGGLIGALPGEANPGSNWRIFLNA